MAESDDRRENAGTNKEDDPSRSANQTPAARDQDGGSRDEYEFLGFVGSYPHSIDAKGRMIIPAAFREPLGSRFAVAPSPDFKAVALYPIRDWVNRRNELVSIVRRRPVAQPILDEFTKYSYTDCESDTQGRLLLPQRIRAWRLGDAREVEVNGAYDHIRIIPASAGQEQDRAFNEKYPDPLAFLTSLQEENGF